MNTHLTSATSATSATLTPEQSARIAANRARRSVAAERAALDAATTDRLARAAAKYGPDALQSAYLRAAEKAMADPLTVAYREARGERAHELRAETRRRRTERLTADDAATEMKYASSWGPSDPTGDAATGHGTAALLAAVDTFAFPTTGRRGAMVAWAEAAAALGTTEDALYAATIGTLHAECPGDVIKRARAVDVRPAAVVKWTAVITGAGIARESRRATAVTTTRPARVVTNRTLHGPVASRIR